MLTNHFLRNAQIHLELTSACVLNMTWLLLGRQNCSDGWQPGLASARCGVLPYVRWGSLPHS